jgi:hypothetical protein
LGVILPVGLPVVAAAPRIQVRREPEETAEEETVRQTGLHLHLERTELAVAEEGRLLVRKDRQMAAPES